MNQCLMFLEILQHSIQILIWIGHSFPQNSLLRSAHRLISFGYHCSSLTHFPRVPLALSGGQPGLLLCLRSSLSRAAAPGRQAVVPMKVWGWSSGHSSGPFTALRTLARWSLGGLGNCLPPRLTLLRGNAGGSKLSSCPSTHGFSAIC